MKFSRTTLSIFILYEFFKRLYVTFHKFIICYKKMQRTKKFFW